MRITTFITFVTVLSSLFYKACCFLGDFVGCTTITGGTGTLGACLTRNFRDAGYNTYFSYRSKQKLREISFGIAHPFCINTHCPLRLLPSLCEGAHTIEHILINNAACCLSGSSIDALRDSVNVNTLMPIELIKQYVRFAENHVNKSVSVINISSGDGELCNLNSKIVARLSQIISIKDLKIYINELMNNFDKDLEYAHGQTPMYSLSKALLNKATLLFHQECSHNKLLNFRILSCCPGNFLSSMSALHELDDAVSVDVAAEHIITTAIDKNTFPGGFFYRYGKIINW